MAFELNALTNIRQQIDTLECDAYGWSTSWWKRYTVPLWQEQIQPASGSIPTYHHLHMVGYSYVEMWRMHISTDCVVISLGKSISAAYATTSQRWQLMWNGNLCGYIDGYPYCRCRWISVLPISIDSRDRVPIDGRLFSLASQLSSSKPFDVRYNHFDWNRSDWCWKQRWFTPHKNSFRSAHQRNHFNSCSTKTLSFPMS